MKLTDKRITEMCENLPEINTGLWDWNYDLGMSYIKVEREICVYDDDDNDLYFMIDFDLQRDHDGYITECELEIKWVHDVRSNEVKLTEKQHDKFLNWLSSAVN